jgi:hypothetical protein
MTILHWLLNKTSPKAREATERACESQTVRAERRSAVSRLVAALEDVEVERDYEVSRSLTAARARQRNGHAD